MAWTVDYTETARKQLRQLDKTSARRIVDFIDERVAGNEHPRNTGKALIGPALGDYWRDRVGDFRIICHLRDDALCILVVELGNRKEIYR